MSAILNIQPSTSITVYYDDSCGICERWKRLILAADRSGCIRFIGTSDRASFRHQIPQAELDSTLVVFDDTTGTKTTKAAAVAAILRVLPLPFRLFRFIALPGVRWLSDAVYDLVAANRHRISQWLGVEACDVSTVQHDR
jgi:predicted DCC family thiol-disulfide oxidoreductase YuxK